MLHAPRVRALDDRRGRLHFDRAHHDHLGTLRDRGLRLVCAASRHPGPASTYMPAALRAQLADPPLEVRLVLFLVARGLRLGQQQRDRAALVAALRSCFAFAAAATAGRSLPPRPQAPCRRSAPELVWSPPSSLLPSPLRRESQASWSRPVGVVLPENVNKHAHRGRPTRSSSAHPRPADEHAWAYLPVQISFGFYAPKEICTGKYAQACSSAGLG